MFAELTEAQRQAVNQRGLPLAVLDGESGRPFLLFDVDLLPAPLGGVRAQVEGIPAVGEGDTPADALRALVAALQAQRDG